MKQDHSDSTFIKRLRARKQKEISFKSTHVWALLFSTPLLVLLFIPFTVLFTQLHELHWLWDLDLEYGHVTRQQTAWNALQLSIETSLLSTLLTFIFGTPLAWFMSRDSVSTHEKDLKRSRRLSGLLTFVVMTPMLLPPSIVGLTLLTALSPHSWLAQHLPFVSNLAFSWSAVVIAQLLVASPLYIMGAHSIFKRMSPELIEMARSLGLTPFESWRRVTLPMLLPGLLVALSIAWARALGEFGATLLFAGQMPGVTQTAPLAIYLELERGTKGALVLSIALIAYMLPILMLSAWLGRSPWQKTN